MPDGSGSAPKPNGDIERVDLAELDGAGGVGGARPDNDPPKKRGFFGRVTDADGWTHVGAGWWERGSERERRPGKSGKSKRGSRGPAQRVDSGERRETGPRTSKASLALGTIERMLSSIHYGIAIALKAPEFQISEEEAAEYAKAVAAVARHYDMGASAKTLDWTNLAMTMGSIYGVRIMGIAARRREERRGGARSAANGHDQAPVTDVPGDGVDWSSMTGQRQGPLQ